MKKYVAYGIGAALVDTEIKVEDSELAQMNVDGLDKSTQQTRQRIDAINGSATVAALKQQINDYS